MSDYTQSFRAAAVQAEPVWLDLNGSIDKTIALMEEATGNGAKVIAFPETWIPGYPWWIWLGSVAWQQKFVVPYAANALEVGSTQFDHVRDAARRLDLSVVLGFAQRQGGSLYMAQSIIDHNGAVLASRRKLKPTHVERSVFGDGDGSDILVVDSALGRMGALCCAEHIQPLTKYAMFSQHEQLHVAAWPSFSIYQGAAYLLGPEVNVAASQQYAVEGQTFVLAPTGIIGEAAYDTFVETEEMKSLLGLGGGYTRIFGPDGRSLAEPLAPTDEGILYADVDYGAILAAKNAYDPVGHYSRPDVLSLRFNSAPAPRVVGSAEAPRAPEPAEEVAAVESAMG